MKNKIKLYTVILASLVVFLGLVGSLFLSEGVAERIVSIVTAGTAIIGAAALFYQFRRDKNLNEASFLVEYSNQFYSTYDCKELMNELETCRNNSDYVLDVEKYYPKVVGYLEWLEALASLVNDGVLQICKIDNVMSYRYFLIVNNKQVQQQELVRNREFYRSIYDLYPVWVKYKKDRDLPIIFEENDLTLTEGYEEIIRKNKRLKA